MYLPPCITTRYRPSMSHYYRFKRDDPVIIGSGRYKGHTGVVGSAVFQRSVDYPDDQHPGYHVVLEDERVVTVRWDQRRPSRLIAQQTPVQRREAQRCAQFLLALSMPEITMESIRSDPHPQTGGGTHI